MQLRSTAPTIWRTTSSRSSSVQWPVPAGYETDVEIEAQCDQYPIYTTDYITYAWFYNQEHPRTGRANVAGPPPNYDASSCCYFGSPRGARSTACVRPGRSGPAHRCSRRLRGTPVRALNPASMYVIEFWAPWSDPCKTIAPHITKLATNSRRFTSSVSASGKTGSRAIRPSSFPASVQP